MEEEKTLSVEDFADPAGFVRYILSKDELAVALESLTPKEQRAVMMRHAHQCTYMAIGEEFGVTRERARQIVAKGMRKLQRRLIKLRQE